MLKSWFAAAPSANSMHVSIFYVERAGLCVCVLFLNLQAFKNPYGTSETGGLLCNFISNFH